MILVDTSIWVDHLRVGDEGLAAALDRGTVFTHPFVVGELACGRMRNRDEVLGLFRSLPVGPVATDVEALQFIDFHQLMGRGIGFIDVHLLAATALAEGMRLWTRDRRLAEVAGELGMAYTPAK